MKVTMEGDGSKPKNTLPTDFRPGGVPVEGLVLVERDGVQWRVMGLDAYGARIFAKTVDGNVTGWLECRAPQELHEMQSTTPVDVVCTCGAGQTNGFGYSPELDLWVHADCLKPKRRYLDGLIERLLAGEVV